MATYGGYSSLDMQQRQFSAAYQRAVHEGWMQAGVATASVGPWPYDQPFVRTPVAPNATVVTETKTIPERKRTSFRSQILYWVLIAVLSVLSIWPAWWPHLLPPARADKGNPSARSMYVVPEIVTRNVAWRYFVISTTSGGKIHVAGDHFAYRDDGFLYILSPYKTTSFRIDDSLVTGLLEETELDWADATGRRNGIGIP